MNPAVRSWFNGTRLILTGALALVFFSRAILSAHPIEEWTTIHYSRGAGFVGVASGEGLIVAVDGSGKIISWPQSSPAEKTTFTASVPLRGIAYGNGQFVVAGWEGQILSSTDGRNWTQRAASGSWNFGDVVFGNGVFLAVGSAILARSTNGIDFTPAALPASSGFPRLFFAGGTFLLTMNPGTNFLSADGIGWTAAASGTSENLYSVGYGNDLFIAFNFKNEIFTSPDARTWKKQGILPEVIRPGSVVEGNGYLVTVGGNRRAFSRDGITWTVNSTEEHQGGDLIFVNGTFFAGGYEHVQQSSPIVTVNFESPATLSVSGVANTQYRIESTDQISSNMPWKVQQIILTSPSGFSMPWTDPRPISISARFYRAVPQTE